MDSRIFWSGLYLAPLIWVGLGILAVLGFKLDWFLLTVFGASLQGANVYGYVRCSREAQQQLQSAVSQGAMGAISRGLQAGGANSAAAAGGAGVLTSFLGFGGGNTATAPRVQTVRRKRNKSQPTKKSSTGLTGRVDGLEDAPPSAIPPTTTNPFDDAEAHGGDRDQDQEEPNPFGDTIL